MPSPGFKYGACWPMCSIALPAQLEACCFTPTLLPTSGLEPVVMSRAANGNDNRWSEPKHRRRSRVFWEKTTFLYLCSLQTFCPLSLRSRLLSSHIVIQHRQIFTG